MELHERNLEFLLHHDVDVMILFPWVGGQAANIAVVLVMDCVWKQHFTENLCITAACHHTTYGVT